MDGTVVYVMLVIFAATPIRSVFGFGEALIAVPLPALRIPVTVAALVSIVVALIIVLQDGQHVEIRSAIGSIALLCRGFRGACCF